MAALETALTVGISITEFWEITPQELKVAVAAYSKKVKREREDRITQAYLTALWGSFTKKLPKLNEILEDKPSKKKKQTAEQMLETIRRLHADLDGETI